MLLWIGGVLVAAIVALWLGVAPTTLLWVGLLLLCPAAMYFGMRGMGTQQNQQRGGPTDNRGAGQARKEVKAEDHDQSGKV
jgi:membrane protein implicated in regulation of membrane protease activity